jgi:hypothetical protein
MAIRSRRNESQQHFDALSISAEIVILGGSTRQMYYTVEKTYEDDRRFIPCILGGYVCTNDPDNIMTGEQPLNDIEWYNQMPVDGDYTTGRITNPSDEVLNDVDVIDPVTGEVTHEAAWRAYEYLISDGSNRPWCEDVPALCLIVRKNFPALTATSVYGVLKFLDQRTGTTVRKPCNEEFSTEVYNTDMTTMRGDSGDEIQINPLSIKDTIPIGKTIIDIPWTRTIGAQLQGEEGDVADAQSCYLWMVEEPDSSIAPSGWLEFNELELAVLVINGHKTRSLSIDARMVHGSLALRCMGCRREEGDEWIDPRTKDDSPFYETRITMVTPGSTSGSKRKPAGDATAAQDVLNSEGVFLADPVQTTGNHQNIAMNIPCHYDMQLRYNGHDVPQNKRSLFLIHWWGQNLKTGVINSFGYGPSLDFVPNQHGYTFPDGFVVWAEIDVLQCFGVVKSGSSVVMSDNTIVINGIYG